MLADVCVEHGYEVSLYRHSAFFTIILVFFYATARLFLFMSFPDALLFQSLPDLIGQSNSLSSGICGFSLCHLRLFSLSLSGLTG